MHPHKTIIFVIVPILLFLAAAMNSKVNIGLRHLLVIYPFLFLLGGYGMTRVEKTRYLIIGNSAGGIGAAEAIRESDRAGVVTIVSDEPYPAYSRPLISEYLVSRCPVERMLFRSPDFYDQNNIQTLFGEQVTSVDFNKQVLSMESGLILGWEKLLLATGGLPIVPRIDGVELEGVFTFNKLEDARAIDEHLSRYERRVRAVVIGGGLIGVSVTEALVKRRVDVTIVEMKDRILNTILDNESSAFEERTLRKAVQNRRGRSHVWNTLGS